LKLYLALNEAGTHGEIGLHARLAILSLRKNTKLEPILLYTGDRNGETKWFEEQGVQIIDSKVPYSEVILKLTAEGRYTTATLGHWLRTNVCLEECEDEYILYTDVDVIFLSESQALSMKPTYFAVAPEFKREGWNYFNAGVMLINVAALRSEYLEFEQFLVKTICERTYEFHDQIAYNIFYRGRWDRLPLEMNWKPYWGPNKNAEILHFHGPKLVAISSILNGNWDWSSDYGQQLGSLFSSSVEAYRQFVRIALDNAPGLSQADIDNISQLIQKFDTFDLMSVNDKINLDFTNFRMFPES